MHVDLVLSDEASSGVIREYSLRLAAGESWSSATAAPGERVEGLLEQPDGPLVLRCRHPRALGWLPSTVEVPEGVDAIDLRFTAVDGLAPTAVDGNGSPLTVMVTPGMRWNHALAFMDIPSLYLRDDDRRLLARLAEEPAELRIITAYNAPDWSRLAIVDRRLIDGVLVATEHLYDQEANMPRAERMYATRDGRAIESFRRIHAALSASDHVPARNGLASSNPTTIVFACLPAKHLVDVHWTAMPSLTSLAGRVIVRESELPDSRIEEDYSLDVHRDAGWLLDTSIDDPYDWFAHPTSMIILQLQYLDLREMHAAVDG